MLRVLSLVPLVCCLVAVPPCPGQDPKAEPKTLEIDLGDNLKMKLVRIEPGKFTMGAATKVERDLIRAHNKAGLKRIDEEIPREVTIAKPFYLGVFTVTQAEYEKVMGKNPSYFGPHGSGKKEVANLDTSRFPVEYVSWHDALEFCQKLSKKTGTTFDLPTEEEWEYACRAGTKGPFHVGDSLASTQANFNGTQPFGGAAVGPWLERPTAVGSYKANAWGLHDMHGNVRQYCKECVARGGSWYDAAWHCRSAYRFGTPPDDRINYLQGFRVVVRLP